MVTTDFKQRVVEAIKLRKQNYESYAKFAVALGINSAQLSRIVNNDTDNVLSDANWISIARKLDVQITETKKWNTAQTPVFTHIYTQLKACKEQSLSGLLCDKADVGKTYTAKIFCNEHKYSVYIDCSQYKSKQKLTRAIAKELGINYTGKYVDVYSDLVFYLKSIPNPIIVLDEAGDLEYSAWLELKALWNATEGFCGWYMMGADGLKAKIQRNLSCEKVGYTELFSRYGSRYQKISPDGKEALDSFVNTQIAMIVKANAESVDVKQIIAKANGSLRRVKIELQKLKIA